jgi:hypothetical protein
MAQESAERFLKADAVVFDDGAGSALQGGACLHVHVAGGHFGYRSAWEEIQNDFQPIAVMRSVVMNHLIHHRAQLGVFLRLNNVAIPGMYGPSADEMPMSSGQAS